MSERTPLPFISQYVALPPEWRSRGCGLVALKIVLDHWHDVDRSHRTLPLSDLLEAALISGAYMEGVGWTHAGLVKLARELGYDSYNRDLPKERAGITQEMAVAILEDDVVRGPVLVSVWKNFDPIQKGGHIVVVQGFSQGVVSLVDPEKETEVEGRIDMPREKFIRGFKMRSICLFPK